MGFEVYRRNDTPEELQYRNRRLSLLAEGAKQLLSNSAPENIVQSFCEQIMDHLDCQVFSNFISFSDRPGMSLTAHAGMPEKALEDIGCPFPGLVAWECIHRPGCQRAAICGGCNDEEESNPLSDFGIRAYACHPLVYQGRNIGILTFGTQNRSRFSENDLDLMRAVTDLVAAAIARKQWEAELERRVEERTRELVSAHKELEGFTYAASHDMRAPLGRINSFCTLLSKNYRERLEGEGLILLDLVQQNATRLNTLVEDLLSHAQLGHQPLPLQNIEPQGAIQAVLHERSQDFRERGVELRLDLPDGIRIRCNPVGLAQVLRNLVDNALKYSDRVAPPIIEIGYRVSQDRCRLWVKDNGIGLDMAYKDRIFETFRRLHTYSEYPGSGIGLALVKRVVERMNGMVWVESDIGRGSSFFVELPGEVLNNG